MWNYCLFFSFSSSTHKSKLQKEETSIFILYSYYFSQDKLILSLLLVRGKHGLSHVSPGGGVKALKHCSCVSWRCACLLWTQLVSGSMGSCLQSPGRNFSFPSLEPLREQVRHATASPPTSEWVNSIWICLQGPTGAFLLALSKNPVLNRLEELLWPIDKTEKLASHLATDFFASK